MFFGTHIPRKPLDEFVEAFIFFDDLVNPYLIERFLPDGNVEIIIDLQDQPEYIYDNETLEEIQACRNGWASGVRTRPISIPAGSGSTKLVVVFKRGLAHPFFPIPMSEISDTVVDADYLWGSSFRTLRDQMLSIESPAQKFRLVEDFLMALLDSETEVNPCVDFAVDGITRDPSQTNLAKLSDKIGYSQKHLISMFKKNVGITPKTYLRVMRFQKAIEAVEGSESIDWTSIALDAGFYDQAHFINDFKALSGFTPKDYLARKVGTLNYVPVR